MSAILVKVTGGKVICRNRESDSPYDSFRLAGAVIVNQQVHTFMLPGAATNETIQTSYDGYTLFEGESATPSIGLVLRAYDIDDNDKWRENRKEIVYWNEKLAGVIENIPEYGDAAAAVLRTWPKVVDQFVKWDKNDVLLSASMTVDLPPPSDFPGVPPRYSWASVRGVGDGVLSSWDYEVFVNFRYTSADPIDIGGDGNDTPTVTYTPVDLTSREEWLGVWGDAPTHIENAASSTIRATIRSSSQGDGLDVTVTGADGHETAYVDVAGPPSPPGPDVAKPVSPDARRRRPAAGHTKDADVKVSVVLPPGWDKHPTPKPNPYSPTGRVGGLDPHQGPLGTEDTKPALKHAREIGEGAGQQGPVFQFGDGVLELGKQAVLEMHQVVVNGHPTEDRALRYLRPIGGSGILHLDDQAADAMLHRKHT
jgi:hypothetical protein